MAEDQLVQDNPINDDTEDTLNYLPIVDKLHRILLSQESEKSMAIGLVGPWGNGKSSVISMLKSRLLPEQELGGRIKNSFRREEKDDYLVIHFLPYLNHNAEELVSEFFRSLSSGLKPYNGKLSNLIIEYSNKLIDVYKKKIDVSFFDKHISSFEKTSAKEMYDDINKRLKETNKTIIVFVDDLDRLNGGEILQVLKLIRNSADFRNVIFLVAMDKEYVIELLTKKKEIFNSRFIDKFFQLEVYLPEIRNENLRKTFDELIKKKTENFDPDFKSDLALALKDKDNLFDDYIKNIRDVKRVINQFVYEYPFIMDGINLKDFLNFTYFKLKFPVGIKILRDRRQEIFSNPSQKGFYSLTENELEEREGRELFLGFNKDFNYHSLKKYKIYKQIIISNESNFGSEFEFFNEKDKLLFIKTLAFLFGSHNSIVSPNSIRKENNFMMLMEQRIFDDYLSENDFQSILKLSGFELKKAIDELHRENKINQLLDRLDYTNMSDLDSIGSVLEVLVYIYNDKEKYHQYDSTLLNKMGVKTQQFLDQIKDELQKVESFRNMINSIFFDNKELSTASRIFLITELWEGRRDNKLWKFEHDVLCSKAFELFEEYLNQFGKELWNLDDFEFYHIIRSLKLFEALKEEVNARVLEFWTNNNIKLLCAQFTEIGSYSYKSFAIAESVAEVFGSREKYLDFVKNHADSKDPEILEYLDFLELYKRVEYSIYILFDFRIFKLMRDKVELFKNSYRHGGINDIGEFTHLYFEHNSSLLQTELQKYNNDFKLEYFARINWYNQENIFTLFVVLKKNIGQEGILKAANVIKTIATQQLGWKVGSFSDELVLSKEKFIENADGSYVKLYSKQP